jgi:hypothetical protein
MIPAVPNVNLPPALVVGALYDSFLQAAMRQFLRAGHLRDRADAVGQLRRPAVDRADRRSLRDVRAVVRHAATSSACPRGVPFTDHEIRLARSIGSVLGPRYHAILNPKAMVERGELFRGAIEDRYAGAFAEGHPYPIRRRATRVPTASRPRSRCCAWRRSRATRTARFRPAS